MPPHEVKTVKETITEAKAAEDSGETESAVELYEQALQQDKLNEYAYNRLMIIYRKSKDKKNNDNKNKLGVLMIFL